MTPAESSASVETLSERKYLRRLLQGLEPETPVVLVGSWARGTSVSEWSDMDVLVIDDAQPPLPPPRIQVIAISAEDLKRRLAAGDDFPQWALRFGKPVAGREAWERLRDELLSDAPWPDPGAKIDQAKKKLETAETLLAMGDLAAAEEEVRFGLSHIARAELLAHRVFPLSRPELAEQLQEIGEGELASMMRRATSPDVMKEAEVREAVKRLRARLVSAGGAGNFRPGT
jgi:predicted nucleotidyltransferase